MPERALDADRPTAGTRPADLADRRRRGLHRADCRRLRPDRLRGLGLGRALLRGRGNRPRGPVRRLARRPLRPPSRHGRGRSRRRSGFDRDGAHRGARGPRRPARDLRGGPEPLRARFGGSDPEPRRAVGRRARQLARRRHGLRRLPGRPAARRRSAGPGRIPGRAVRRRRGDVRGLGDPRRERSDAVRPRRHRRASRCPRRRPRYPRRAVAAPGGRRRHGVARGDRDRPRCGLPALDRDGRRNRGLWRDDGARGGRRRARRDPRRPGTPGRSRARPRRRFRRAGRRPPDRGRRSGDRRRGRWAGARQAPSAAWATLRRRR